MFISSALVTCTVVYYDPLPPSPSPPPPLFFSTLHGYHSFIYVPSIYTYHFYLCFFGSIQCIAPWQCQQKMTRGEFFLEDMMKISSFWVSVFFYVYFICFNYMYGSVLWPLALFNLCPPSSPSPSPPHLFFWYHSFIYVVPSILIISIFAFFGCIQCIAPWQCQQMMTRGIFPSPFNPFSFHVCLDSFCLFYVSFVLIISLFAFFRSLQLIVPRQCQWKKTQGFLDKKTKINCFWVSLFFFSLFHLLLLHIMCDPLPVRMQGTVPWQCQQKQM